MIIILLVIIIIIYCGCCFRIENLVGINGGTTGVSNKIEWDAPSNMGNQDKSINLQYIYTVTDDSNSQNTQNGTTKDTFFELNDSFENKQITVTIVSIVGNVKSESVVQKFDLSKV